MGVIIGKPKPAKNIDRAEPSPKKQRMTTSETEKYDFDLIVIGGGSGGIACAKAAGELGVKAAVFDFVKPSTQGTTWGFGGTCVNVGCIPKKLMHTAAIMGHTIEDSVDFGWKVVENKEDFEGLENRAKKFDWNTLVQNVQMHIKSLNFGYKKIVEEQGAKVFRSYASFVDAHTIEATDAKGIKKRYTSKYFVIAVGGRPKIDDEVKGAKEHCITSDDIFSLKHSPGKTLVIGASYVALECAGFLTGTGYDTTVMIRSIPLRGFDRQCAEKIRDHMMIHGTNFLQPCVPLSIEKQGDLKLVTYMNLETNETLQETYDTVLYAIGRYAVTGGLNLDSVGIKTSASGKIPVNEYEQTSVPNIYAIGDVIEGGLELTPVAIQAGRLLAKRLFDNKTHKMDYRNVPTTVFTPLEYGCVGYPEEEAIKKFGKDNLKIYYKSYNILEYKLSHKEDERKAFVKLICNTADDERVVGFHYLGPNAGEVTQGVGIAIKLKATKEDFDNTVGIHPTAAETFTTLEYGKTEDTGC